MTPAALCLLMLVAGTQAPQAPRESQPPPPTATIRGRVTAADTGQPLPRAEVWLHQVDSAGPDVSATKLENRSASTDVDGRYEFKNLGAGRYFISVNRPPYVRSMPMKAGELRAGETLDQVDFTLPRGGVITGRILDEFGEPLPGLEMSAMRMQMMNGKRQLVETGGRESTNDNGEFRIYGLEPAQYCVRAMWRRMGGGDPTSPDRSGYPLTFFPGTTNEAEAQRFTIAAGQTVDGLVMALSPIKTARVEGMVVDVNGRPLGNTFLDLLQTGANRNFIGRQAVRPDGTFTFTNLTPGDYVLQTQTTPSREAVAMLKLTVGSEDIKDLRLVALPLATLSGRIVVDPSTPPPRALSLMVTPEDQPMTRSTRPEKVADNLTFRLTATPGRNRIVPTELPPGWMMRSVRVNGVDTIDDGFDVKPGEKITGIDVELTAKTAAITGLVKNTRGEPAKGCTLVIFPTDSRKWKPGGRHLRMSRTDQDGRFNVSGLPSGDYYAIALEAAPGAPDWTDPEYLERLRGKATSVSVDEGETKPVDLRINTIS
jgi:carboxypeptidase family protein